jgi:RNA 3'-terminal phosphate cyclase (ATP)
MATLIQVDGSLGGGQVLRSALSLSALTGKPFAIDSIRKQRARPGLMRQHLTAVRAMAQICGAELSGDELGSTRLTFTPGAVRAGTYHFPVGSAGSTCLVLQTVLPPLALASGPSELSFEGGTHNPLAPAYPYLDRVVFPLWERMGVALKRTLVRCGFAPAGGGRFEVCLEPTSRLNPLELFERGPLRRLAAEALVSNLPHHIATRELAVLKQRLNIDDAELHLRTPNALGHGNALFAWVEHEHVNEMAIEFGAPHVRAEKLAEQAASNLETYLASDAAVGEHLADQLLIPLALAGAGGFRTLPLSDHARSNMDVIRQFLPVTFSVEPRGATVDLRVSSSDPPSRA